MSEPLGRTMKAARVIRGLAGFGGYRKRMYLFYLLTSLPFPFWRQSRTLCWFAGKPFTRAASKNGWQARREREQ